MAKRKAFLHIGPTHSGSDFLDEALALHADALAGQRIRRPAKSADEMLRAALEIRRVHKSWGYKRREVEGAWSAICRRAYQGQGHRRLQPAAPGGGRPATRSRSCSTGCRASTSTSC